MARRTTCLIGSVIILGSAGSAWGQAPFDLDASAPLETAPEAAPVVREPAQQESAPEVPPTTGEAAAEAREKPANEPAAETPLETTNEGGDPERQSEVGTTDAVGAQVEQETEQVPEVGVAGYTGQGGFHLASRDGKYLMRFTFLGGFKFEPEWTDGDQVARSAFAFVRPGIRGNFYKPWLRYLVSMELAGASYAYLLHAHLEAQPWDELGARFGQQVTPVSRHTSFNPAQIFFPDFATVASYFWSGRQRGLTVYGRLFEERLDYFLGLYGGSPLRERRSNPDNYIAEARLTASPLGPFNGSEFPFTSDGEPLPTRLSFTVQGYHGELNTSVENYNPTNSVLTPEPIDVSQTMSVGGADIWFQTGPLLAFGEYYRRHVEDDENRPGYDSQGIWGEAVVGLYKDVLGAGVRANWIDPNLDLENDQVRQFEGAFNWFIHPPMLVLKLRYAYLDQDSPGAEALGGFRLPFPVGTSHVATLQFTLAL